MFSQADSGIVKERKNHADRLLLLQIVDAELRDSQKVIYHRYMVKRGDLVNIKQRF
jgi:hypothetical protein